MDVQKEVEEFLLEWENITIDDVYEKTMDKISNFKKQKNIIVFLKLLISNLDKKTYQIIVDAKKLSLNEKRKYISKFKKEKEKAECIITIYKEFKKNYVEEKKSPMISNNNQIISNDEIEYKDTLDIKETIEEQIKLGNDIDSYDLPDSMEAFAHYIRNCNIINDNEIIIKYSDYLCNTLVEYLYNNNKMFVEFSYLLDALKNKINEYDRYSDERRLLKNIQKRFKSIYKIYSNTNVKENKDVYFDIIDYYLEKENFFQIQELIKRKPEICNLSNDEGHVAIYILEKYIDNFKKMTKNKMGNYINVNFLKEVYMLFTKSPALRIKYEDRQKIDSTLNEFSKYVNSALIKRKRKIFALKEAKSMKSNNFYSLNQNLDLTNFSDDNLVYEKQRIINLIEDYVSTIPLENTEDAFVVGNRAYSLSSDSSIKLKMHSLDISNFAKRKSVMNMYFEQCELKGEKVDDFILRGFNFQKDKQYPVITYELEFFLSGKFKSMDISKNFINITNIYNTMYNRNLEQKEFFDLFTKSVNKNGGILTTFDTYIMNDHFNDVLINAYTDFIKKHLLPFIYYGYKKQTEKELDEDKNFLATKLNNLDKVDTMELLHILTSRVDKFHYSQYPIENPVYDLKLIDNLNFLGLENQRMLNDIYFNIRAIEEPKKLLELRKQYYQYYDKKVDEFNESINYVDMSKIKKYRGKMLVKKQF